MPFKFILVQLSVSKKTFTCLVEFLIRSASIRLEIEISVIPELTRVLSLICSVNLFFLDEKPNLGTLFEGAFGHLQILFSLFHLNAILTLCVLCHLFYRNHYQAPSYALTSLNSIRVWF